jgi:hypothetical protein
MTTPTVNDRFDFFSTRLNFIEVTKDQLLNIELWHYLSAFESHVYGVFLQYDRIKSDLVIPDLKNVQVWPAIDGQKAGLDIYYYILTWDKLKKIYDRIVEFINRLHQMVPAIPKPFTEDFKLWKKRIENLFSEFDSGIRNEYEHPSLAPYSVGQIIMWGGIQIDNSGDIKAHVGKDKFTNIRNEHCMRIQKLRTDLFDLFLKHFSEKPLTQELIKLRNYIEENIDSILKECKATNDTNGFNDLLSKFTMYDIYLSKEGVALSRTVKEKFYSVLWNKEVDKTT